MTPPAAADPAASARRATRARSATPAVSSSGSMDARTARSRSASRPSGTGSPGARWKRRLIERARLLPVRSGTPRSRPGTGRPRGDRTRADRLRQLPVRVDVRRAARRGAPHARRPARRARRRVDAARRLGVQRPVPRRPTGPDRLTVVRAARGRHAVGGVSPVLRALPGAARADGPARRAPCRPSPLRARRRPARPRRAVCSRGAHGSTSGCCPTSTSTHDHSAAMPATPTRARPPGGRVSRGSAWWP